MLQAASIVVNTRRRGAAQPAFGGVNLWLRSGESGLLRAEFEAVAARNDHDRNRSGANDAFRDAAHHQPVQPRASVTSDDDEGRRELASELLDLLDRRAFDGSSGGRDPRRDAGDGSIDDVLGFRVQLLEAAGDQLRLSPAHGRRSRKIDDVTDDDAGAEPCGEIRCDVERAKRAIRSIDRNEDRSHANDFDVRSNNSTLRS